MLGYLFRYFPDKKSAKTIEKSVGSRCEESKYSKNRGFLFSQTNATRNARRCRTLSFRRRLALIILCSIDVKLLTPPDFPIAIAGLAVWILKKEQARYFHKNQCDTRDKF